MYKEIIDAMNRHAAALEAFVSHVEGTPAAGKAATKPAATKAAGKPAAKATGKKITEEKLKETLKGYLGVSDKETKAEHIANMAAVNEYFGVARATDVDESQYAEYLHYISLYQKGLVPTFSGLDDEGEAADSEEGDEGDSLV